MKEAVHIFPLTNTVNIHETQKKEAVAHSLNVALRATCYPGEESRAILKCKQALYEDCARDYLKHLFGQVQTTEAGTVAQHLFRIFSGYNLISSR